MFESRGGSGLTDPEIDERPLGWTEDQLKQFREDESLYGDQFDSRWSDDDLPGMWALSDFTGGQTDDH